MTQSLLCRMNSRTLYDTLMYTPTHTCTLCDTLVYTHDTLSHCSVVHFFNLFLRWQVDKTPDGDVTLKLADFGLAMEVVKPIFMVCGTPTYVAPEILSRTGQQQQSTYQSQLSTSHSCWSLISVRHVNEKINDHDTLTRNWCWKPIGMQFDTKFFWYQFLVTNRTCSILCQFMVPVFWYRFSALISGTVCVIDIINDNQWCQWL